MKTAADGSNLHVLFEDNHLLAVNKRCGDLVQGDKTGDETLLDAVKNYIATKYQKPGAVFAGVVHRLDRPTSGVVVFARTSKALARMNALFSSRETEKVYHCLIEGKPQQEAATLTHFLVRNEKNNTSKAFEKEVTNSKKAVLHYKLLRAYTNYSLLEIQLETGRHHQIRAQLAACGMVIKGDLKYGAKRSNPNGGISLHARELTFVHPVAKTEVKIRAPYPAGDIFEG